MIANFLVVCVRCVSSVWAAAFDSIHNFKCNRVWNYCERKTSREEVTKTLRYSNSMGCDIGAHSIILLLLFFSLIRLNRKVRIEIYDAILPSISFKSSNSDNNMVCLGMFEMKHDNFSISNECTARTASFEALKFYFECATVLCIRCKLWQIYCVYTIYQNSNHNGAKNYYYWR